MNPSTTAAESRFSKLPRTKSIAQIQTVVSQTKTESVVPIQKVKEEEEILEISQAPTVQDSLTSSLILNPEPTTWTDESTQLSHSAPVPSIENQSVPPPVGNRPAPPVVGNRPTPPTSVRNRPSPPSPLGKLNPVPIQIPQQSTIDLHDLVNKEDPTKFLKDIEVLGRGFVFYFSKL